MTQLQFVDAGRGWAVPFRLPRPYHAQECCSVGMRVQKTVAIAGRCWTRPEITCSIWIGINGWAWQMLLDRQCVLDSTLADRSHVRSAGRRGACSPAATQVIGSTEPAPRGKIAALDLERVWLPGMAAGIGYSADGGLTWQSQAVEGVDALNDVWFDRLARGYSLPSATASPAL